MLTCKRGGTELREKTEKLCSEISLKGEVTEQTLETSVDIKNLLDRTRTDSELVASELERMEKTLEQLKPLITEVKSLIRSEKKPVAS
jgi:hypothetical protein